MPAVFEGKGLFRSRHGNWMIRRTLDYPLETFKTIHSLKAEWNSTVMGTLQRIVDHYMICTQRKRRNYRTQSSTVEDHYIRAASDLEVPNKQDFQSLISGLKAPDAKTFDSQMKANMEHLT